MENNLPWPNEYKQLFIEGGEYYEFAHFGWGDTWQQFHGYCMGYKESADILIQNAIASKKIYILDTVVFPAFFLYRQFIELSLKQSILMFSSGSYREKVETIRRLNHNLIAIWGEFSSVLPSPRNDEEKSTIEVVKKYIIEFDQFDKSSFSFRYPIRKDLALIFGKEKRINLRHVKERMDELGNFFSGTHAYMADMQEMEQEMRAEFEDEYYNDGF